MGFIAEYGSYWVWFGLATVLLALEVASSGFRFFAASVAALVVGCLTMFYPFVALPIQLLFFGVLAAIFIWMAGSYLAERRAQVEKMQKIVSEKAYVGREFTINDSIADGHGTVNVDGVVWQLRGDACDAGSRVRVTDMGAGHLTVECVTD